MADSKIEWTDATWNPVRGCALVSPGCENCYAMKQAHRFSGAGKAYEGLTVLGKHGPRWVGRARFVPEMLAVPLRWRRARRVFVNSMSDLFHEDVTNEQIAAVFGVMAASPQHTFQVLTKRPARMLEWFQWAADSKGYWHGPHGRIWEAFDAYHPDLAEQTWQRVIQHEHEREGPPRGLGDSAAHDWPLPNVWLGVSVEDQKRADERIPLLLQVPAAVRFLSCEPLLGPVVLEPFLYSYSKRPSSVSERIDWVIVGGESGGGARPFAVEWARSLVRQCHTAGVACFVKQLGANYVDAPNGIGGYSARAPSDLGIRIRNLRDRKGGDMAEWPEDLRVREWPEAMRHG